MRRSAIALLASLIGLAVSSNASALVNISLTQIGGTYDAAVNARPGDTLELRIDYSITDGLMIESIFIALDVGDIATFVSGTETGPAFWENGDVAATPVNDSLFMSFPGQITYWEKVGLGQGWGTAGSCIFDTAPGGSCSSLGTVMLSLTGQAGRIETGSILSPEPGPTAVYDADFQDITALQNFGSFLVRAPEPTTASLLGLGLLVLTVACRRRGPT